MGSVEAAARQEGYKVLETTRSVDEEAMEQTGVPATIPAAYVEKNGKVYLLKENGTRERIGTSAYWQKIKQYPPPANRKADIDTDIQHEHDLRSCGLCSQHKNSTALLNIAVTNRCDLRCWYCFFYEEKAGFVYEPSLEDIMEGIRTARRYNGYVPPIQITGGEPAMRDDLADIIAGAVEMGSPYIQLNSNSISVGIDYYEDPDSAIERVQRWRDAGLKTIYTSFDGVSPDSASDPKNHYEIPFALQAYIDGGIKGTVLVPTVSQLNLHETPDIVRFAMHNMDKGVKGVNFQPISMVGYIKKGDREKLRVVQSDIVDMLEQRFGFGMEAWYPVSTVASLADIIGNRAHYDVHFYNNEKCGIATYVYVDRENMKLYPITEFLDVDRFIQDANDMTTSRWKKMVTGASLLRDAVRYRGLSKALAKKLTDYIIKDELPNGESLSTMLENIFDAGSYDSLRTFHYNFLFLGMMHFQDYYNYDVNRVQRCSIHYAAGDKIIPFCTYNVYPSIYRDAYLEQHKETGDRAERLMEQSKQAKQRVQKFREHKDEITSHPVYQQVYDF
ncbi:MAG: radical SAM protein [Thermoplasmatota archaeon]